MRRVKRYDEKDLIVKKKYKELQHLISKYLNNYKYLTD